MKGVSFLYYTQEQIDRANQADLVLFLQSQGEPLERAGQEYRWKRHDSLTVRGNKWYRHSQSKLRAPLRLPATAPQPRQPNSEELPHSRPPH